MTKEKCLFLTKLFQKMKKHTLKLLCLLSIFVLISCGGDDDYTPTETETEDTQNPTSPTNLTTTNKTETSLQLSWDASTDDEQL